MPHHKLYTVVFCVWLASMLASIVFDSPYPGLFGFAVLIASRLKLWRALE